MVKSGRFQEFGGKLEGNVEGCFSHILVVKIETLSRTSRLGTWRSSAKSAEEGQWKISKQGQI